MGDLKKLLVKVEIFLNYLKIFNIFENILRAAGHGKNIENMYFGKQSRVDKYFKIFQNISRWKYFVEPFGILARNRTWVP